MYPVYLSQWPPLIGSHKTCIGVHPWSPRIAVGCRYTLVKAEDKCTVCTYPLMTRSFYLFPCTHKFHMDCLIAEVWMTLYFRERGRIWVGGLVFVCVHQCKLGFVRALVNVCVCERERERERRGGVGRGEEVSGRGGRTVDGGSVKGLVKGNGKNVFIIDCWCDVTVVSNIVSVKLEKKGKKKNTDMKHPTNWWMTDCEQNCCGHQTNIASVKLMTWHLPPPPPPPPHTHPHKNY